MAVPQQSSNPAGGIFQYLLKINGTDTEIKAAQAKLSQLTPVTAALYQALNLLPEGEIKNWVTANPVQFWKKIIELFTGRTYQSGQYRLAERYIDQVLCQSGNPDSVIRLAQVPDNYVPVARLIFTLLFGVRINNDEDLWSLDYGVSSYYQRPNKQDIPQNAVERAVFLKQNYYPASTYNKACWDLSWFEKYPLVAPIPEMNASDVHEEDNLYRLYNGELPGGAIAVNGLIPVEASTIVGQDIDGSGTGNDTGSGLITNVVNYAKANPIETAVLAALAVWLGYEVYEYFEN